NSNTKISAPLRLRGKIYSATGARFARMHVWWLTRDLPVRALVAILNSSLRGKEGKWGGLPKQSPD
ncbi:MAG TPA: hypothetical protein PK185_16080, partial [Cyclobacteriaceae bacterium]|nr:hypothetical protein [Cyclobacteriaceae bacterium]